MDLDEIATRLYALPPAEFTAARDERVRAAKQAGDAPLAKEIGKLRKPTVSAWALNRLAHEQPGELDELLEVGERLREAWQAHDADALAELTRRRAQATGRLSRLIRERSDLSGAAAAEVDQTLDAAVVDAEAAEQVRRGHLVKPLSYSGFAPAPIPREQVRRAKDKPSEEETRQAEERRAREREEAEAAYTEWRDTLAQAVQAHEERADKVAKLAQKLDKARKKLAEAQQRLDVARREERLARQRLERM
ncbi:hypothetical protein [Nonomuraea soli]|uniref:Uncharacterized protein n=1 Tax=Nonomuraea soli TaxID=1032476 RepID=A0A7W0HU95_9ACTN|nr:hypothetical protein [Nonomuraea soli]MBA2895958.1 hypothetical protein [Nonomuraea soli]